MTNKIFITSTYKGLENKDDIEKLCKLVRDSGFDDFCFIRDVEHYQKMFSDPKELMKRSKEEIEKCDYLLIDLTDKPTGRAYEAGIAYALGKKIITIMKSGTKIKDTTRGISVKIIEYQDIEEITPKLKEVLNSYH